MEPEDMESALSDLSELPFEPSTKRDVCERCRRPTMVCLCGYFPVEPLPIQSTVIILQHPHEESRCLATVPLLQECVPRDKCIVVRGKRFRAGKNHYLDQALESPDSFLLYPGRNAIDLRHIPPIPVGVQDCAAVIVLDGTWAQAKSMFFNNARLHHLRQVQLNVDAASKYVIRTQPTRTSVSTLECIAHTLAWLEQSPSIVEVLVQPLQALCQHQLDRGATQHHSKEDADYIPREYRKLAKRRLEDSDSTDDTGD